MFSRIEHCADAMRLAADDAKRLLASEAVDRMPARGFVHRQSVLAAAERKARIGNASGPWEQNRNSAAMGMRAPVVGTLRAGDHFVRVDAIAKALETGFGDDHSALGPRFERD